MEILSCRFPSNGIIEAINIFYEVEEEKDLWQYWFVEAPGTSAAIQ